jgi:hypothetical protein
MIEKLDGTWYKKDFPTLGLKQQPQYAKPVFEDAVKKINELVTEANESQNREKQLREAIKWVVREYLDIPNGEVSEELDEILNSTKE